MADTDKISANLSKFLDGLGKGSFSVQLQTRYNDQGQDAANAGITLVISNPELETDNQLPKAILAKLAEIPALAENIQFESPREHGKAMANHLREFIAEGAKIPDTFVQWFERQGSSLPATEHALAIRKESDGIKVEIQVPEGADPAALAENIQSRKEEILTKLAKRVAKYPPYAGQEDKAALEAAVKNLDFSAKGEDKAGKRIVISIRSAEQVAAVKDIEFPSQLNKKLSGEELEKLTASNPLNALQNGDGKSPENPAHLQKALARAILSGKGKAEEIFSQVAGSKDMQIAVAKSLITLTEEKPALTDKVKAFLQDETFKEHSNWHRRVADVVVEHSAPHIEKVSDGSVSGRLNEGYKPGTIEIDLPLPAAKFNEVLEKLQHGSVKEHHAAPAETAEQAQRSFTDKAPAPAKSYTSQVLEAAKTVSERLGLGA